MCGGMIGQPGNVYVNVGYIRFWTYTVKFVSIVSTKYFSAMSGVYV